MDKIKQYYKLCAIKPYKLESITSQIKKEGLEIIFSSKKIEFYLTDEGKYYRVKDFIIKGSADEQDKKQIIVFGDD